MIKHSTGVLTSQTYTKQLNHQSELLINAAERAAVSATYLNHADYPADQLNDAWKLVKDLLNSEWNGSNLLIMTSGNFDGQDLEALAVSINSHEN